MAPDGFLLVDKAGGWTSHDVVAKTRRALSIKKVGHAGTLDPMATGLLVLGIGRATRLLRFVQRMEKEYTAEAVFGVATDTLDAEGDEVGRSVMRFKEDELTEAVATFIGTIPQVPPMVSAKKVGGKRLYDLARRGETVEREPVMVEVREIEVTGFRPGDFPTAGFRIVCGTGTYIRSLADDIARSLGGRAHLAQLRRTRIGHLSVEDAVRVDEESADLAPSLIAMADALAHLPAYDADAATASRVSHGQSIALAEMPLETDTRIVGPGGELLAIYAPRDEAARPEVVLA